MWVCSGTAPGRVDHWFRRLQLVSAAAYSLGHGGNDAQKTMGIIAGALFAGGYLDLDRRQAADSVLGDHGRARRDRARHAVGRLADHPHDGVAHHQAARRSAVSPPRPRERSRCSRPRTSACRSARRTPSRARSSVSGRSGACRPCAGVSREGSSGRGCSPYPRRRSSPPSSTGSWRTRDRTVGGLLKGSVARDSFSQLRRPLSRGSSTVKIAPPSRRFAALTRPSCSSTRCLTMARPSPVPPGSRSPRERALSTR